LEAGAENAACKIWQVSRRQIEREKLSGVTGTYASATPLKSANQEGVVSQFSLNKRAAAESFGTFWLVFGGCGSAVLSAAFPDVGIGLLGVSLAFGLSVLTMAYAISHISGCHLNPAVSVGLAVTRRFPVSELIPYIVAQVLGATLAALAIYLIASGNPGFDTTSSLASNGYGAHSPGNYSLTAGFLAETLLTFFFVFIILGATDRRAPSGFAPIAIGFALTLIHLIGIPVTNVSVNPARSTGPAIVAGGWAIPQLWMFWVAPLLGAVIAGAVFLAFEHEGQVKKPSMAPSRA
jgi:aquaporin Z